MTTSSFSLKISKWDREKLWNSWQGNVGSHKRIGKLEVFIKGHKIQVQSLDKPQELRILHEDIEIK